MPVARLLLVGWDSAEPSIIDAMIGQGKLPHLAALAERGRRGTIRTTVPDTSMAAWTAAMTGLSPGHHGLVNFIRRPAGQQRLVLMTAADRLVPTLPWLASRAGLRSASMGVPGTWPPAEDAGVCISGFDSPLASRSAEAGIRPRSLQARLRAQGLAWPHGELDELAVGPGWHRRALPILLRTIEQKRRVTEAVLGSETFDLATIVFSESDTVAHHFWALGDAGSPRHTPGIGPADAIEQVYAALDETLGRLLALCGEETAVLVLSDHGARGASDRVVHLNRWLAEQGFLRFSSGRAAMASLAGRLRDLGGRYLPAAIKRLIVQSKLAPMILATDGLARFGGIDLAASQAFSDELPQNPGIWIQLAGREPQGRVAAGDAYEGLRDSIAERLLAWRDPHLARPVVSRVWRREEATPGAGMDRSPDLLVDLACWSGRADDSSAAGQLYRLTAAPSGGRAGPSLAKLDRSAWLGGKGTGTSGAHAPDGILFAAGGGVGPGLADRGARLVDICPTALALLGLAPPAHLEGRVLFGAARNRSLLPLDLGDQAERLVAAGRDAAGEQAVRKRLEGLGYL